MRVVIAGGGSVGRFIAEQLHGARHDVTIVDNDPRVVDHARRSGDPVGVTWLRGRRLRGRTRSTAPGSNEADVVAAVTGDDEDNLVISLLAKQEFGVPRVVARVNNPKNEWMFNELWGVDVAVSTPHLITGAGRGGGERRLVRPPALVRGRQGAAGRGDAGRGLAGRRQARSSSSACPRDATVVAVLRAERLIVPRGDTVLRVGDEVVVLVTDESEDDVRGLLVGRTRRSPEPHGTSV